MSTLEDGSLRTGKTPLPYRQLFIVSLLQGSEPLTSSIIFPFVNQAVRESGITGGDETKTGYYAGAIESIFFIAECLTVVHWGRLSDRIGRKPVMLIGLVGLATSMITFGLSKSYWLLLISRFIQGMSNGNMGMTKNIMAETHPDIVSREKLTRSITGDSRQTSSTTSTVPPSESTPLLTPSPSSSSLASSSASSPSSSTYSIRTLLHTPSIVFSLINLAFLAFADQSIQVILPLSFSTPTSLYGLAFPPYTIGVTLGLFGLLNGLYQIFILPLLTRRFGFKGVHRFAFGVGLTGVLLGYVAIGDGVRIRGFISLGIALPTLAQDPPQDGGIWDQLETSTQLKWTDCYNNSQCSRFQVPLNYSNPDGETASIAMIRVPSPLAGTDQYRGPILLNPGGPGGSGVELVAGAGEVLSQLLGPRFDVVSFDPRGVGFSTPRASFFPTEAQRQLWGSPAFDVINATSDGLARIWARAQITGALAAQQDQKHPLFEHFNTENTARDMLRMVEAHEEEKLQYWGFSYGTVLGATFASLFPDRVERVVDSENYFATLWSNNLLDSDKAMQTFFDGCFEGGPDLCPFYEPSPKAIERKLDELTRSIFLRPVPVMTNISYGLVDYARLRATIAQSFYSPYSDFPRLARGLADLVHGNGTALYQMLEMPVFDCSCGTPVPLQPITDARIVISCTDGQEIRDTVDDLEIYVRELLRQSQWGEVWATLRIACTAWPKQAKRHFRGPFIGNTSHPILWIGNTADPVTPIASAHKMAQGYPGSVVLTQDSSGHSSIAAPSTCTTRYVRDYFVNGTMPAEGIVCPVLAPVFSGQPSSNGTGVNGPRIPREVANKEPEDDQEIAEVLQRLRENFRVPSPF
ncbi:hypothetical protein EYR40_007482 [Pleurotus pulmonarius]|nr:hypothetical protein EYR38_008220 [Pleurotus pulmonarius]KAF4597032.1 hypothetical protein EYR40_007482 [Pleurotus pulmonarius]